jgi:hypothetical protein
VKAAFGLWGLSAVFPAPVLWSGIGHGTPPDVSPTARYNQCMRCRLLSIAAALLVAGGCHQHPLTDYRPLDKAGMFSASTEQLKALNTSDAEIAQVVALKQAGVTDDNCVALISAAHAAKHPFYSTDSVTSLIGARYSQAQILEFARANKLDAISGDAVMFRLIGLSDHTVQILVQRRLEDRLTLSSAAIGRLKNTGLTEKQILEKIDQGMTDEQAQTEASQREAVRNHAHTDFVRVQGRRR